ncbi:putative proteinase inhibitor I3, Kunitz legume, kunitz inhibitor STI-like superfamily [Helianthus annuus]|uniref:Uncharacterized protein n=1 Tax=Helianthus annuus TaxID=4232 RepID=A0A251UEP4_HELAN|nr:miraculin [Helianthus annuus]KAF5800667.1 putative proteinase inhibitor I3, Kunitz legume, kunitz inhibitor STI-like superfamily [Helianthus annuus]KAJ0559057.1 putative proteinase inhibitor I3, Kunitz legume, kunitz inhibitor STI-like superfamily [Helianthus annuus]KAJ0572003.1 putative proteinase inhibitor I3, Kunitz legume, kunitz inhibitor STI-like superfamily [Helianthus annuus]KAJ0739411.1 putative proteinase inhibitor I3, Kunitz legume, kunitz inhibitor STI-like superfamily [Helianthu
MKTIILFSLALVILAANAARAPAPVLDIHGKYLHTKAKYIANLLVGRSDGALYALNFGKKSCSLGVGVIYNEEEGYPLIFTPVNPKKGVIHLSTDVNIKFSASNDCNESSVWRVKYDKGMKQNVVMVGGVEGNPGPKTLENWFKIEKTKDGYKLVFCPSVCSYCKVTCKDVGIVKDKDGWLHLALSNEPLSVTFYRTY